MAADADGAQRASDALALAITAGLATALLTMPAHVWRSPSESRPRADTGVTISLAEPEALPQSQPPPEPPRTVVRHERVRQPPAPTAPAPSPAEPLMAISESVPAQATLVAASAPATAEPVIHAAPNADLEAQYAAALREDIEQRTHSPEFAQARPRRATGEVLVRFTVTRAGAPKAAAVLRSSGSSALDQIALAVVSSGHYPAMPPAIFTSEPEHPFAVTIEFRTATRSAWAH